MSSHENPYASPVEALRAFLAYFWIDRSDQVALTQWKTYVQESSQQAGLLLEHLKAVVENPPTDLADILQRHGWVYLFHDDAPEPRPYSPAEYVEWLRQMTASLESIYHSEQR
jgi:hypothetical protein